MSVSKMLCTALRQHNNFAACQMLVPVVLYASCGFVCLTFVDASKESLMMNFQKALATSQELENTKAIAVAFHLSLFFIDLTLP